MRDGFDFLNAARRVHLARWRTSADRVSGSGCLGRELGSAVSVFWIREQEHRDRATGEESPATRAQTSRRRAELSSRTYSMASEQPAAAYVLRDEPLNLVNISTPNIFALLFVALSHKG